MKYNLHRRKNIAFFLLAFLFLQKSYAQAPYPNYGEGGLTGGVLYSRAYAKEINKTIAGSNSETSLKYLSGAGNITVYGGFHYFSKLMQSKNKEGSKNFFQFQLRADFYRTESEHTIAEFTKTVGTNTENYVTDPDGVFYESSASNRAFQATFIWNRKWGENFYIQTGAGYRLDYTVGEQTEWIRPFSGNSWQSVSFDEKSQNRVRYNQDIMLYFRPYFYLNKSAALGLEINTPLLPLNYLFYGKKVPIPGTHSNYMLKNNFVAITLSYRLDTESSGCGSCP